MSFKDFNIIKCESNSILPNKRWGSTITNYNDKLCLIGGSYKREVFNTISFYDKKKCLWNEIINNKFKRTNHITHLIYNKYLLIHGGVDYCESEKIVKYDFVCYDIEDNKFIDVESPEIALTNHASCLCYNNNKYVLLITGGIDQNNILNNKLIRINLPKNPPKANEKLELSVEYEEIPNFIEPRMFHTFSYNKYVISI